jgi:hypothetical protein
LQRSVQVVRSADRDPSSQNVTVREVVAAVPADPDAEAPSAVSASARIANQRIAARIRRRQRRSSRRNGMHTSQARFGGHGRYCHAVQRATRRRIWITCGIVGTAAFVVLAAKVTGRYYYDPALHAVAGWVVPPDLGIFLDAGDDLLAGRTPYQEVEGIGHYLGYVYPPLLAFAVTPLSVLPVEVATILWALLSGACVVGGIYLLGVRDWRCYPVALLWPFNREAIEYGAIGPFLLLVVAACWRYRDRPWGASTAAGGAVALKLFLWPLALWLAFTGRAKAAALAIGAAIVLVFVPWAAIGFEGLAQYPALLQEVADQQDFRSYSPVALFRSLGMPAAGAEALSLLCGLALLALAFVAARDSGAGDRERDRRSLTLVLAAALVLTPVVWPHYLVLLLAPVALARPRLSLLWLFPLAATILYTLDWYRASPEGEVLPVVTITLIVTAVFVASLRRSRPAAAEARAAPAQA